ncbi:MAG TPA: glycosyltransferase family 1 protein [Candidatus Saccharimonadales bacterium]|nr:glycosyltransferase family 1 protein [Candidatus Saccharimonadales bacterium]
MAKIFIDASALASSKPSGVAYANTNTIIELAEVLKGTDKKIILLATSDTKTLPDKITAMPNVTVRKLPISARVLRLISRLPFMIPLDLFLGRGIYLFMNFYNFPVRSKSITFIYDVSFLIFPETIQPKNLKFFNNNMRKWVRRTDVVVTPTETSKKEIIEHLGVAPEKILALPVPLGDEFKRSSETEIQDAKSRYNLPEKYILYLGNIEPRKNLANLVAAFAKSETAKTGISLLVVGADTWKAERIQAVIDSARKQGAKIANPSKFVENTDLPAVISGADFLALPSIHEGFGVPPTQALACGTPVLVSDIPVLHEVLGNAAHYMDPNNVDDMAAQIDKMTDFVKNSGLKSPQADFLRYNESKVQKILDEIVQDKI